jgi:tRNA G18 (ribose-2'-O)-methylase SpoU
MRKLHISELNRLSSKEFKSANKLPVVVVLDNVRSAYNVGSVFRTADAFRIEALHLCGISAKPPHKDIHKTALGATETVEWKYFEHVSESLADLKEKGYTIYVVEQAEPSISLFDWKAGKDEKYVLVFGHEVDGVSETALTFARACIEIPQFGTKHSLNISVSAGIVLWEVAKILDAEFRW